MTETVRENRQNSTRLNIQFMPMIGAYLRALRASPYKSKFF